MPNDRARASASVRSVNCPSCGAVTAVRTFGHAVNVVCQSCQSILDPRHEGAQILQRFKEALRYEPLIPLGTRGRIPGVESAATQALEIEYEVVGFQVREIIADGVAYQWREYLLFNPYQRFHYLTEYAGHWNIVSTLRSLPQGGHLPDLDTPRTYQGQKYRHFQTATATTIFVLGEFPWQVRVGDTTTAADYVAPPQMLSAETNADKEVTWSRGSYVGGAAIWAGFSLPARPPAPEGIFSNQPSPFAGAPGRMARSAALLMALAAVLWIAHLVTARQLKAFSQEFVYDASSSQDASFVTDVFALDGRQSAVRMETVANLENQWMDVGYALINEETGQTYEFARAVSYYHGVEDGESWSEGSPADDVTLSRVPAGRYFLRLEPEADRVAGPIRYRVTVVRDPPTSVWFIAALVLLAVPPLVTFGRAAAFERRRWSESDHASGGSSSSDSDSDSDSASGDD